MPEIFEAGNDGELPSGFGAWRRGITYTVRPEMLSPLVRGREYRMNATVRRTFAAGEVAGFQGLYERCVVILGRRNAMFTGLGEGVPLHSWIQWQAWWSGKLSDKYPGAGDGYVANASITIGLSFPNDGEPMPLGQDVPQPVDLLNSGGDQNVPTMNFNEGFVEFDFDGSASAATDTTISYGEYVEATDRIQFDSTVRRAENLACFHGRSVSPERLPEILRREWFYIGESRLLVVMLYLRAS